MGHPTFGLHIANRHKESRINISAQKLHCAGTTRQPAVILAAAITNYHLVVHPAV